MLRFKSRAAFLWVCSLSLSAQADWQLVGGADAWGRQAFVLDGKGGQGATFPAWQQQSKPGNGLSFGGRVASVKGLPLLLGGLDDPNSHAYVQGRASGEQYSLQLRLAYRVDDVRNGDELSLQHSHVAYRLGNWFVGAGQLDWFWGPGWDSSLLLQTPVEMPPTLFLQRAEIRAPEMSWLRWMGPWNWQMFAGQLERKRDFASAKLLGARLTVAPLNGLELGLARTAMWGGDGRPESLSSLQKLILGSGDNCESLSCRSTEPGNQLASVDLRYRWSWGRGLKSVYAQAVGEDEAGGLPSRNMYMVGLDWLDSQGAFEHPLTLFLEFADTTSDGAVGRERFNYSYEHHIYSDGYRYEGYALGSVYDGDSRSMVLGAIGQLDRDLRWQTRIKYLDINRDARDGRGRHTVSPGQALQTLGVELGAERYWRGAWFSLMLAAYDDQTYLADNHVAGALGMRLQLP